MPKRILVFCDLDLIFRVTGRLSVKIKISLEPTDGFSPNLDGYHCVCERLVFMLQLKNEASSIDIQFICLFMPLGTDMQCL